MKTKSFEKNTFKGSCPGLKFQDLKMRYLASRTCLCTQNSFVGVIFDAEQKELILFKNSKIVNNFGIKSEPYQFGVAGSAKFELG